MLDVIEKLLILQDRDRKILRTRDELIRIDPERQEFRKKLEVAQAKLEALKLRGKHIESDRKKLELEADASKQNIDRYSIQQFQTKKNEEYKALGHQIDSAKAVIVKLEDQQLELMEQGETAQKEVTAQQQVVNDVKKLVDGKLAELAQREQVLKKELADLEVNRSELAGAVSSLVRSRKRRVPSMNACSRARGTTWSLVCSTTRAAVAT
jgi:uncharacterized protein